MKRILQTICCAVLAVFLITGCATIMHGSSQEVSISSNPSNAEVTVNQQPMGTTPVVLDLDRKDTHRVAIELDGHLPYEMTLSRGVSGWVAGNIIFGGLIGLAVDAISGGMYKLSPEQITAEMRRASASTVANEDDIFITVVLEPKPDWKKVGQLEKAAK